MEYSIDENEKRNATKRKAYNHPCLQVKQTRTEKRKCKNETKAPRKGKKAKKKKKKTTTTTTSVECNKL